MALKVCLDCRQLFPTLSNGRCVKCRRAKDRRRERDRPSPTQRGYGAEWTRQANVVKAAWRAEHGDTCPGFEEPAHALEPGNPLTVDHIVPKSQGGTDDWRNLTVLCKRCQGRKGRRENPPRQVDGRLLR